MPDLADIDDLIILQLSLSEAAWLSSHLDEFLVEGVAWASTDDLENALQESVEEKVTTTLYDALENT